MASAASVFCFSLAASNARVSIVERVRRSPFNFSSRAAKSRIALLSASSCASMSLAPKFLLTIFSDFFQQFVQLLNNGYAFVDADKQLLQIFPLEFLRFGITPVILGLIPLQGKLFCEPDQTRFAAGHAHDDSSVVVVPGGVPSAGGSSIFEVVPAPGPPPILISAYCSSVLMTSER